uniref:Tetraspanin n=1 Tax=Palpitomonas bilix TaxID=652834 RepID=A0A7S3DLR4_9EUKA|mmetsp:Transcript_42654/g.109848  ORF Transcript_42654/g.109848 Transcript_42654/m.109848 type:complete len:248 (+) Transcript_42654:86-829(+)
MGCGKKFCQFLLIIINVIFIICGVAIAGLGAFVYTLLNVGNVQITSNVTGCDVSSLSMEKLGQCFSSFCGLLAQYSNGMDVCSSVRLFPIGFMIIGGAVMIIAIFGCCGAMKQNRVCLMIYFFVLLVIFLSQAAVAVLAFAFAPQALAFGQTAWDGFPGNNTEHLMQLFGCCGFQTASTSETTFCNNNGIDPNLSCLTKVQNLILGQIVIVGAIGGGVVFLELIGIIGSCVVCKRQKNSRVKVGPRR